MLTKRLLRFSIGAMLVLMAGVAVLINHEVRRAKAIEQTVNQIDEWNGQAFLTTRQSMPNSFATILPKYWTERIYSFDVALYIEEEPEMSRRRPYRVVKPDEIERLLELGALGDVISIHLQGSAISRSNVYHLCESSAAIECILTEVPLSSTEIEELRSRFPECAFEVFK